MQFNKISLTRRLIISNLIIALVILPLFAIALTNTFAAQARLTERQTLQALSYELLAKLEIENGHLSENIELSAPEFSMPDSGLYALIRNKNATLWESSSVLFNGNDVVWPTSNTGKEIFSVIVLAQQEHFNWQIKVLMEQQGKQYPFTVNIVKSTDDYAQQLSEFTLLLWPWLFGICAVFVALQCVWVWWFRQPMRHLVDEIHTIKAGEQERIKGTYPPEIATVNDQLNQLLTTEQLQRERYKNKLADLAHSLKTPLAVMNTHQAMPEDAKASIKKITNIINHQLKKAHSNTVSWRKGCDVQPIINDIVSSLDKLYYTKRITFDVQIDTGCLFYGDEEDFFELIGNLLDNACKACTNTILIKVVKQPALIINISDDGVGLNAPQMQAILQRGHRADTYDSGQGIGLSVVKDIVNAYEGKLDIQGQGELGGATFIVTFSERMS